MRSVAAIILAAILLWASGFGIFDLLSTPVNVSEAVDEVGAYVSAEVNIIIGFCAEEVRGDKVIAIYGLAPINGKYTAVRFTQRYFESAEAVLNSTYDYINLKKDNLEVYVNVSGTLEQSSESLASYVYDWYGLNREQLISMGVIYDTEDYATFLSDYVLNVDMIGGKSQGVIITCTVGAGIFALYALVEMILMLVGFYLPEEFKTRKAKLAEAEDADGENSGLNGGAADAGNFYENFIQTYTGEGAPPENDGEKPEDESEDTPTESGEEAPEESDDENTNGDAT